MCICHRKVKFYFEYGTERLGCCKFLTTVLQQFCEYREVDLKLVSLTKTCAEVLQKWNIHGMTQSTEAILLSNVVFEKSITA